MNILKKLVMGVGLTLGLAAPFSHGSDGLFLYSFAFRNHITVHLFDDMEPVSDGIVDIYTVDGNKIQTVMIENGKAIFRFPIVGDKVRLVAYAHGRTAEFHQYREG